MKKLKKNCREKKIKTTRVVCTWSGRHRTCSVSQILKVQIHILYLFLQGVSFSLFHSSGPLLSVLTCRKRMPQSIWVDYYKYPFLPCRLMLTSNILSFVEMLSSMPQIKCYNICPKYDPSAFTSAKSIRHTLGIVRLKKHRIYIIRRTKMNFNRFAGSLFIENIKYSHECTRGSQHKFASSNQMR